MIVRMLGSALQILQSQHFPPDFANQNNDGQTLHSSQCTTSESNTNKMCVLKRTVLLNKNNGQEQGHLYVMYVQCRLLIPALNAWAAGHNTLPHDRLPQSYLVMNGRMTSQLKVALFHMLRGSSMYVAYLV